MLSAVGHCCQSLHTLHTLHTLRSHHTAQHSTARCWQGLYLECPPQGRPDSRVLLLWAQSWPASPRQEYLHTGWVQVQGPREYGAVHIYVHTALTHRAALLCTAASSQQLVVTPVRAAQPLSVHELYVCVRASGDSLELFRIEAAATRVHRWCLPARQAANVGAVGAVCCGGGCQHGRHQDADSKPTPAATWAQAGNSRRRRKGSRRRQRSVPGLRTAPGWSFGLPTPCEWGTSTVVWNSII